MSSFEIHPKYTLWKDSYYSKIYKYNEDLLKELPKYDHGSIQYSTIVECAITKFLNVSSHFTECYTIYNNPEHLYIFQRYKGDSLPEWIKKTPLKQRLTDIPILFKQLLEICLFLEKQGLQHTDIKPLNILYENQTVSLIDYNCMSVLKLVNNQPTWTDSIGTWKYAAPEIIHNGSVHSNSIVWSLAMILCYLFNDLPNTKKYYNFEFQTEERLFWKKFYKYVQYSEQCRYAFKKAYQHIPDEWKALLYCMLRWDPDDRISLQKTLDYINTIFHVYPTRVPYFHHRVIPYQPSLNSRLYYLNKLFTFIESTHIYRFCTTFFLWDSFQVFIIPDNEVLSLTSCYLISGLIFNEYIEDAYLHEFLIYMNVSYKEVEPFIWKVAESLQWNLYQKSTDLYLHDHYNTIPWDEFKLFYSTYKEPYSTESLSDAFVKSKS